MLPTEPNSELTVSQANQPVLNPTSKVVANNPLLQFANKAGSLIMQHPFWVFVIGSFGIHAAFAVIAPNPLQKPEPPEVIVSTLPVVKLPPKSLVNSPKANKSIFDNLFVKPESKTGSPLNTFPNISSRTPLSTVDLDSLSSLEDLPPVTDFSFSPLPNNLKEDDYLQFVKPQTQVTSSPQPTPNPRFTQSGKIDNTTPVKPTNNIKPELQANGLKNDITSTPATKNTGSQVSETSSKNLQGTVASNSSNDNRNEKEIGDISVLYTTDKQILDLLSKNLIKNTQIAPVNALISDPDLNREKGITWIPPKVTSVAGKSGSVTFMWLVNPKGEVQTRFLKSSGIKELDDIARETIKGYKFKPIEDSQSGKYRLVTAKYDFP